jgi:hypothetical protein
VRRSANRGARCAITQLQRVVAHIRPSRSVTQTGDQVDGLANALSALRLRQQPSAGARHRCARAEHAVIGSVLFRYRRTRRDADLGHRSTSSPASARDRAECSEGRRSRAPLA